MDLSPHNGSTKSINDWRGKFQYRTSDKRVYPCRTSKAKEEKSSPRKKQSDPQPGATYQKLIDKVFGHQMRRNMKVNVDDMVIKSDSEEEMMADITETLERLRAINLKLNPKNSPSERERERSTDGRKGKETNPRILRNSEAETPLTENKEAKNEEVKRKEPEPENAWKLFTDGASSSDGSGAGLMVVSPEGKEYTYALSYSIEHIKREQKKKADALSKLASMTFSKLAKEVLVEVIQNKSITEKGVADIAKEEGDNCMTPIREYLRSGALPDDPQKARKLRIKAPLYKMMEEKLYQRSYLSP
ncbi:hypothetical protein Tco_0505731 [Tanacetum coccineum]